MARKESLLYNILPAGTSLSASFNSAATVIRFSDNISYQINTLTSDSIGYFEVQVSNDYSVGPDNTVVNAGTWDTLTLSAVPIVAAANDVIGISLNQVPYLAIRLKYNATTPGTGTCEAFITSKNLSS